MLNLKLRLREWAEVIAFEYGKEAKPMVGPMLKAIVSGVVPRDVWRARILRGCGNCPIYDRKRKACRLIRPGKKALGCGCFVVFKAMFAAPYEGEGGRGCWGYATLGAPEGWPEYLFPSRWAKLIAFFRFLLGR